MTMIMPEAHSLWRRKKMPEACYEVFACHHHVVEYQVRGNTRIFSMDLSEWLRDLEALDGDEVLVETGGIY